MKKQILILTFFVAAILAGNNAFGQDNHYDASGDYITVLEQAATCITPTPLQNCTVVDELHPVQGQLYKYTAITTSDDDDVRWFVVNNVDISALVTANNTILPSTDGNIDPGDGNGDYILSVTGGAAVYNVNPSGGDGNGLTFLTTSTTHEHQIEISWKFFNGHSPNEVLLVAYVESDDNCTNNIAVYRIIPEPAFTLDVAVLTSEGDSINDPSGNATPSSECVSPLESAIYASAADETPGTGGSELTVDYGENWAFFIVNAAGYIDSWQPTFQISYDAGNTALEASWAYLANATDATAANWTTIDVSGATASGVVVAGAGTAGTGAVPNANGECIVVRVRLDYGTKYEHATSDGILSLAVNGFYYDEDDSDGSFYNGTDFEDLKNNGTSGTDCEPDGFSNDQINYIITPRPEVDEGTPDQEPKTGDDVN